MKTHPSSNQLLQQNYAHGLLLRKSTRSALPCAFAASELLIASAQCSIEDREWSWPGRFLSWYVQSKKMIRKILSIYEVHMYIYIFTHYMRQETIHTSSIYYWFSCISLFLSAPIYSSIYVSVSDSHVEWYSYHTHTSCPTGTSADAANVRVKRTALYHLNTPKWTNAKASFHPTFHSLRQRNVCFE